MKFEASDRAKLLKIGVLSLLDLALVLPKGFEDTTIAKSPREGQVCINVKITSLASRPGMLTVLAFCEQWQSSVKIVIFNAKSWHYGAFKVGKEMAIYGLCSYAFGSWQIVNPKITTKIGQIVPKFKTELKDEELKKLILKYLNLQNLLAEGLNEKEAKFLADLQRLDEQSVQILYRLSPKIELFDIDSWLKSLPFTPTNDQLNAVNDIRDDLAATQAKRRVIMGDVGSGKTLVILAAALSVYPQSAILMAPTSILSEQIYNEAKRLLPPFMNVMLVRSGEKKIDFSGVNLIIGTHALLFHELPNSPLVMVDEQHRFGSNQRKKIEELASNEDERANFVQFSATPIPRTLSLIQSEIVNFSFLKQMPFKKNITSQILGASEFGFLLAHIKKQLAGGFQVAIIYPLVESSESSNYQSLSEAQGFWLKNFKNVFVTHGKDKEKEEILRRFREEGEILLSTTVVEVGISLPRLNTIVIVGAERLGLATLHQLRGRVGRNGGDGYCFLFTKLKEAPARLKEFCATNDGFKVAELDLKNRQSGDILNGFFQHGATFNFYDYEDDITQAAKARVAELKNKAQI